MGDPILRALVGILEDLANSTDGRAQLHLTLQMGGFLVCGIVITQKEFYLSDTILNAIDERIDALKLERHEPVSPEFVHLKDAQFFVPGQPPIPSHAKVLWRGRIDAVAGFTIKELFKV